MPYVLLALRTVMHNSIGFSPAKLAHGKNTRTPETLIFEKCMEEGENELATEYVFRICFESHKQVRKISRFSYEKHDFGTREKEKFCLIKRQ